MHLKYGLVRNTMPNNGIMRHGNGNSSLVVINMKTLYTYVHVRMYLLGILAAATINFQPRSSAATNRGRLL